MPSRELLPRSNKALREGAAAGPRGSLPRLRAEPVSEPLARQDLPAPGARAQPATAPEARLARPLSELDASYDVVIIGSGYGGSIAAALLARAQQPDGRRARVCLLERGREHPVGSFPETLSGALGQVQLSAGGREHGNADALFWLHAGEVSVLHGCGLGGTSLINAGVALRPDERIWQDPVWPAALASDVRHGLAQSFVRVAQGLGVTSHPAAHGFAKHRMLRRSASALGQAGHAEPIALTMTFTPPATGRNRHGVAQSACNGCGNCVSGCNVGAKNTLAMNYLPEARDAGAEIFCEVSVHHLEADAAGGYRVFYEPLHRQRALFDGSRPFLRAAVVIVAAGVLGTTEILLRSKRAGLACSERLGQRVSGNGDMLAFAHAAQDPVDAVGRSASAPTRTPGPAITGLIDGRRDRPLATGYVIQEGAIPGALAGFAAAALRGAASAWGPTPRGAAGSRIGRRVRALTPRVRTRRSRALQALRFAAAAVPGRERADALGRTQTLLLMSHDAADGVIALRGDLAELRFPSAGDAAAQRALHTDLERAADAIGGRYVPMPSAQGRHSPVTVHPLGGAVMADDARDGATDHCGRLFSASQGSATHAGLYVCDASLLPRSLGVNPLLTIAALADRNARLIATQQGWTLAEPALRLAVTPRPAPAPTSARQPALRFRFTEKLVGHLSPDVLGEREYLLAAAARGPDDRPSELVITVSTEDCLALVDDPVHTAAIGGTATIPCLSPEPLVISHGVFNLFVDAIGERSEKRMCYRMRLTSVDGQRFELDGHKDLSRATGRGLWADTTLLFTEVHAERTGRRTRVAQGVLRVSAPNFVRELSTMRSSDSAGRPALSGIARYGLLFGSGLAQIYRPRLRQRLRRRHLTPGQATLPPVVTAHGRTSLAYSAVSDPSVHSFESRGGAVLYGQIDTLFGRRTLVCGDPLCAPEQESAVLDDFLSMHPDTGFFQVGEATARRLGALGHEATQLGIETVVDLTRFSLRGHKMQNLRSAHNRARREGIALVESSCEELGAERMMRISRAWMCQKTIARHEIAFFARPIVYADEPGVRKFFALRDGEPIGFIYLDPLFEAGKVFGYAANLLRHEPDAPSGVCDALLVHAALQLQREGLRELNLGMSPFFRPDPGAQPAAHPTHSTRDTQFTTRAPRLASALVELNWRVLNALFHYRGIAFHKRRWRATERPVYYAGKPGAALRDFYAAARMTGVL